MRATSAGNYADKRKSLPRIRTGQSQLLQSASAAVADALGIDPNELPQPFQGLARTLSGASTLHSQRGIRPSSSVYSTSTPTDYAWSPQDGLVQQSIAIAVADVLGLQPSDVYPADSFVDLGGDWQTAQKFSESCRAVGLSVRAEDVLTCRTLAELETLVIPLDTSATNYAPSSMIVSPLSSDLSARTPRHLAAQPPFLPPRAPARVSRMARRKSPNSNNYTPTQLHTSTSNKNGLKNALPLNSAVSQVVVLRPKAGPLEGQAVAFLTLPSHAIGGPADCEVALLDNYDTSQLLSITQAVEADYKPKVLVILKQIPLDQSGNINRRKLQTWIQNINEETYQQIMANNPENLSQLVGEYAGQDAPPAVSDRARESCSVELASIASSDEIPYLQGDEDIEWFELSPMQRLYFHTAMGKGATRQYFDNEEYRFNQGVLLKLKKDVDLEDLSAALEAVIGHHSMLRSRFRYDGVSWRQGIEPEIPNSYDFTTYTVGTGEEVEEIIGIAQGSINMHQGPVFAAHHFQMSDGFQLLYLVAHRLVVDLKSWPVIANDLDELLTNGTLKSWGSLPFPNWVGQQRDHVATLDASELTAFEIPPSSWNYWGIQDSHNTYGNATTSGFAIDAELVSLLSDMNGTSWSDCSDMFIAALLLSFSHTFRDRSLPTLWNQEHERATLGTGADVSQTVGWFTSLCPLQLDICHDLDIFTALNLTKRTHHSVTANGVPYFTASMVDAQSTASFVQSYVPMELTFTFAGDVRDLEGQNGSFEQIPVPCGSLSSKTSDIGPHVGRISAFEVSAVIDQGEVKFKFLYNQQSRHQDQIQRWIHGTEALLREALGRLKFPPPALLSSDIPFLETTSEGLAQLNEKILPALNIDPTNVMAMYPATESQESILVNELLAPQSSNAEVIYEFDTSNNYVDVGRICAAWQGIVDRHCVLRTIFIQSVSRTGLYDQLVLRRHSPNMFFLESKDSDSALEVMEKTPPLPWTDGTPLHRLTVCQAPKKALLKLEASQAICDHTSVIMLFKELEQAYLNESLPRFSQFPYQEYLKRMETTPGRVAFWKEELNGFQPCFFPTLASSEDNESRPWENTVVDLPISRETLAAFAVQHSIDVSAVLQVAWALVLRDYVGTDDVCFGYHSSNRDMQVSGLKEAVGCFTATSICRLFVPAHRSIVPMLEVTDERYREAAPHQLAAIGNIQHALGVKGSRIFNTCMSFGTMDMITALSPNKRFRHVKSKLSSEYDFSIDVNLYARKMSLDIGQRIMNSSQATIVAHAFGRAVQTIIGAPQCLVRDVDLFSERDHEQILTWNSKSQPDWCGQSLPELIAQQATKNPDAQAVCAWDGEFTYCELFERSMALAGHLLTSGLSAHTPVPVIVDKSRWAVVAMLAVLYANAILVPVDAEEKSLFSWVIKATGARAVLASDSVRRHLSSVDLDLVIVNEYTVPAMSAQAAAAANPAKPAPTDVACILFSPGSPETQKGIVYNHKTLAMACMSQGGALRICLSSRVMQLSSYSVDIALSELFTTLVNGGCVCIPSASERLADFTGAVRRMKVNWSYMTTTLSRKLNPNDLRDLAIVCFRTRHLDVDTYLSWAGEAKVLLAYGPPDTFPLGLSVVEVKDASAIQCIGNPFCGNFWVVSPEDHNRLMPVGAMGELIIGSPTTLAREIDVRERSVGEWTRQIAAGAAATGDCDTRLIKTNQLVRYREEGLIEFVLSNQNQDAAAVAGQQQQSQSGGWSNAQLAQIEQALRRCLGPGVDVAVEPVSFENEDDESECSSSPILTAFVELADHLFHAGELSKLGRVTKTKEKLYLVKQLADVALRESLPSRHLLPQAYIPVKTLPVTPTLEVDRKELRKLVARLSPRQLLKLTETSTSAPKTSLMRDNAIAAKPLPLTKPELQLRDLWARVLGVADAGAIEGSDRFLSLGGDKVLAHRLVVLCREHGIIVPIVDVLRNPSLSELARGVVFMEQSGGTSINNNSNSSSGRQHSTSVSSGSSLESMTTGSSLSDRDELKEQEEKEKEKARRLMVKSANVPVTTAGGRGKRMARKFLSVDHHHHQHDGHGKHRPRSPSLMHMMRLPMR